MSNSASRHLSSYGVTLNDAYSFIISNLSNPSSIYNTCKAFGVSTQMISEIIGSVSSWVSPDDVNSYFLANGLNPYSLSSSFAPLSIETRSYIHSYDSYVFNYKLGPLDASAGSNNFIIDLNQNINTAGQVSKSGVQTIVNFGLDDSLIFDNATNIYVSGSSFYANSFGQTIKVTATSATGAYNDVYLVGVNPQSALVTGINSFNSLSVGDIYIA